MAKEMCGREYSVRGLARLAGVSVRTLHHYDHIGLLKPGGRSDSGYRRYGRAELERLQQILFYRELDLPLEAIGRILDDPDFDPAAALRAHRRALSGRLGRLHRLLETLDKTLAGYEGGDMLTDGEMYAGFTPEQAADMRREARERWDPALVEASERRVRAMGREGFAAVKAEGQALTRALAGLMDRDPADPSVQAAVARHHAWIRNFYEPTVEVYRGLGRLYAEEPRFRANYEKVAPGLAGFLRRAMEAYCDRWPGAR